MHMLDLDRRESLERVLANSSLEICDGRRSLLCAMKRKGKGTGTWQDFER